MKSLKKSLNDESIVKDSIRSQIDTLEQQVNAQRETFDESDESDFDELNKKMASVVHGSSDADNTLRNLLDGYWSELNESADISKNEKSDSSLVQDLYSDDWIKMRQAIDAKNEPIHQDGKFTSDDVRQYLSDMRHDVIKNDFKDDPRVEYYRAEVTHLNNTVMKMMRDGAGPDNPPVFKDENGKVMDIDLNDMGDRRTAIYLLEHGRATCTMPDGKPFEMPDDDYNIAEMDKHRNEISDFREEVHKKTLDNLTKDMAHNHDYTDGKLFASAPSYLNDDKSRFEFLDAVGNLSIHDNTSDMFGQYKIDGKWRNQIKSLDDYTKSFEERQAAGIPQGNAAVKAVMNKAEMITNNQPEAEMEKG